MVKKILDWIGIILLVVFLCLLVSCSWDDDCYATKCKNCGYVYDNTKASCPKCGYNRFYGEIYHYYE